MRGPLEAAGQHSGPRVPCSTGCPLAPRCGRSLAAVERGQWRHRPEPSGDRHARPCRSAASGYGHPLSVSRGHAVAAGTFYNAGCIRGYLLLGRCRQGGRAVRGVVPALSLCTDGVA